MRRFFILFIIALLPSIGFANWQISGKVTGADGKPPALAQVHLINFQGNFARPFQSVTVGKDGLFQLEVAESGFYRLFVTAANHDHVSIPITNSEARNIELRVQLAPLPYKDQFDAVQIIGDWNNFNFKTAENMDKQSDGTFSYERQVTADTVCYQLVGITRSTRSVNGTQSDYYIYDGGGDYRSVLKCPIVRF